MAASGSVAAQRPPGSNESTISLALPDIGVFAISDFGSNNVVDCLHTLIHSIHMPLDPHLSFHCHVYYQSADMAADYKQIVNIDVGLMCG